MLTLFSVQRVVFRFDMLCLLANVTGLLRLDCCVFFFFLAGLAVMRAGAGLDGENMHEIKNQTTDDRPMLTCPRRADSFVKAGASEEKHRDCGNVFVYFLVAVVYTLCTTSACIVFLKNLIADASSAWSAA